MILARAMCYIVASRVAFTPQCGSQLLLMKVVVRLLQSWHVVIVEVCHYFPIKQQVKIDAFRTPRWPEPRSHYCLLI